MVRAVLLCNSTESIRIVLKMSMANRAVILIWTGNCGCLVRELTDPDPDRPAIASENQCSSLYRTFSLGVPIEHAPLPRRPHGNEVLMPVCHPAVPTILDPTGTDPGSRVAMCCRTIWETWAIFEAFCEWLCFNCSGVGGCGEEGNGKINIYIKLQMKLFPLRMLTERNAQHIRWAPYEW